ncbi:hypothetical protein Dimus_026327 [Dionaea muscipula]
MSRLMNSFRDLGTLDLLNQERLIVVLGVVETTIFLCNSLSTGTCVNATEYVFWDVVHPSEAANELLANSLLLQGIGLIT